jgi:hypothetical protein
VKRTLALLIGLVIGSILAALLLAAPIALALETIELLRMDAVAEGVVEGVGIEQAAGEPRLSRTAVRFAFLAEGRRCTSDRVVPGFVRNLVYTDGGDRVAGRYRPGQRVIVHYRRSDPNACSLEYGWYVGSVAVAAILGGVLVRGLAPSGKRDTPLRKAVASAGVATSLYGLGLPVVVDPAVRVAELPAHAAAWLVLLATCLIFAAMRRSPGEEPSRDSSWKFLLGGSDDGD